MEWCLLALTHRNVFFVYIVDKPGKYNHQVQYRSDTVFVQNAAAEFAGYHSWAYMHTLLQQYNMQRNLPMTPLASCIELPIMRLIFNQNEAVNTQLYHVKAPLWTIIILPPNEFAWHEISFYRASWGGANNSLSTLSLCLIPCLSMVKHMRYYFIHRLAILLQGGTQCTPKLSNNSFVFFPSQPNTLWHRSVARR